MYSIKISKKTLKFDNIEVNKTKIYRSKQPTDSNLVDKNKIVTSDRFKYSDYGFKYVIGYKEDNIIRKLTWRKLMNQELKPRLYFSFIAHLKITKFVLVPLIIILLLCQKKLANLYCTFFSKFTF